MEADSLAAGMVVVVVAAAIVKYQGGVRSAYEAGKSLPLFRYDRSSRL